MNLLLSRSGRETFRYFFMALAINDNVLDCDG